MTWKKKTIELAKLLARSVGKCVKCGKSYGRFDGAHIISVKYSSTSALLANIMCLCPSCHVFAKDSWHQSPSLNIGPNSWFENKYPGKLETLNKMAQKIDQRTELDWKDEYNYLMDIYNKLKGKL